MTPHSAKSQSSDEIYALMRVAAARKQPIAAIYDGLPRLLCPHLLGRNKEGLRCALCYQFGGESSSGLPMAAQGMGGWRRIAVDKLIQVALGRCVVHGAAVQPSRKSNSMPVLKRETTRKKGSEAVAAATGARE